MKKGRDFGVTELAPHSREWDEKQEFPRAVFSKLGALGLMGVVWPAEYGGSGMSTVDYALVMEELARVDAGVALSVAAHSSLCSGHIFLAGTDEQKRRFLTPFASGTKLGCYSLTEPEAGSDATNQHTRAERAGDAYVLNGRKIFVTSGREAQAALVFAQTDPARAHHGVSAFIVEKGTPGFTVVKTEDKLGIRASDTAEFLFENCRVPVEIRLGEEGEGFSIALGALDGGRLGIAAQAVGIAVAAYEASLAYARERKSFGVPIGEHQMVQWMLADMATGIEAARLLTRRAAFLKDQGLPFGPEAAMAKLFASEMAMRVTTDAIQVHGGYGFITEYPVERHFRDAKITQLYEGTSQIQKLVIARHLLGGEAKAA
jgi:alkylation response protein AidB-like acyl-CoA dehydrogenase